MKFLVFILSLVFVMNANAGVISAEADQAHYNNGDIVTVDVFVNDLNPTVDYLELDFSFDNLLLAFIDDSWFDSDAVFDFGAQGYAYSYLPDTLIIQSLFLDGITNVVGTSFKLGELQFTALSDITTPLFSSTVVVAQDIDFNDVAPQAVPEPSTLALFSLMGGLLLMRRKQNA